MNAKRILAALMAMTMVASFSACKGDKEESTTNPTVTGGASEDVFDLNELAENGEDVTIDAGLIDADSGEVTTGKSTGKTTKASTTKPNIKNETTVSGNLAASSTDAGYKLSWSAVSGAKKYNVYRADTKDGTYHFLGSTTNTYYVDKNGSNKFFYKITVAKDTTATTAASTGFKGSTIQFSTDHNGTQKQTFVSTNLNNTYIAFIRNEYAKKGMTIPAGRLAYVQIADSQELYVFQFDNSKTWNSQTLEQVHFFVAEAGTGGYFSFFTKTTGTTEYVAARNAAIKKWNEKGNVNSYEQMESFFLVIANHENFQKVLDASY